MPPLFSNKREMFINNLKIYMFLFGNSRYSNFYLPPGDPSRLLTIQYNHIKIKSL